mgnify:CR=1 FL=1
MPQSVVNPPQNAMAAPDTLIPCQGSQIVARVGSEVILESDLVKRNLKDLKVEGSISHLIEVNKDKIPPDEIELFRLKLLRDLLPGAIQSKVIFLDARRAIPAEGWTQVERHISSLFDDVLLEKLMKREDVSSARELDERYRSLGSSLEREKKAFLELEVARQYMHQQMKKDEEITYDQMLEYYHGHLKEFTQPARARWEELMVTFSKYPDKASAYDDIARMGNLVFSGVPFAHVAKSSSHGFTAADGGQRKWTDQGVLACQELDRALFHLPLGQLSPIIEGPTGFHILRVVEREATKTPSFLEAQADIRERIVKQRTDKQMAEYFAKVQAKTPIWTVFEGETQRPNVANRQESMRR